MASTTKLRWTAHAMRNLLERAIDRSLAEHAILSPEAVAPDVGTREVRMQRYWDADLDQEMLLRCVVEETEEETVIVTVYKTSQMGRYLRRAK